MIIGSLFVILSKQFTAHKLFENDMQNERGTQHTPLLFSRSGTLDEAKAEYSRGGFLAHTQQLL